MILWIIGWMFTVQFIEKEDDPWWKFFVIFITGLFFWPGFLGCELRDRWKETKETR